MQMKTFHLKDKHFSSQVRVCSPKDLDCLESIQTAGSDCLERCDGLIVDALDQNKAKDNSKIENLLADYENYKFPNKSTVPFPYSLHGKMTIKSPQD